MRNEKGRYIAREYKIQLQLDYMHIFYQAHERLLTDLHQHKELILN